ncbi:MAG: N-6 DNA methylase, partial [Thalassospira sp.]|uniref:N-6 DNA methylase n=1 Tax=Thalassospira sp. TaxID=1912094 RepID=UPI0032EEED9B
MQLLEAASARVGGFDLQAFQQRFSVDALKPALKLIDDSRVIVQAIDESGIPPALALSALAREGLEEAKRKSSGAYHTDFRLAFHLARNVEGHLRQDMKIIDPACGAGILLAAVSIVACGSDRILANEWLRNSVFAADLSPLALRGTLIALSSLTDDLDALSVMRDRWKIQDSLMTTQQEWLELAPEGFDLVIANPPWEKVKLSRHEFIKGKGNLRSYGSSYEKEALSGYEAAKLEKSQ